MLAAYETTLNLSKANIKAVLSTTVLPVDGLYLCVTLEPTDPKEIASLVKDVPHYIGHPDTKTIVESLGAVQAPEKLFRGLSIGESALCFPITQGKSNRAINGFTAHQEVDLEDLQIRLITRLA